MRKNEITALCFDMYTYARKGFYSIACEELEIQSNGTIIHQKYADKQVVFSYKESVSDIALTDRLFEKVRNVYRFKEWEDRYYITKHWFKRQRFGRDCDTYRQWVVTYCAKKDGCIIIGDTTPDNALEIRNDILRLFEFSPVPELFFLAPDGTATLPGAEDYRRRRKR